MGAKTTTSERAIPRRVFWKMLRDVRGGQASRARPGVQTGCRLLYDVPPRARLATGTEVFAGRAKGTDLVCSHPLRGRCFAWTPKLEAWCPPPKVGGSASQDAQKNWANATDMAVTEVMAGPWTPKNHPNRVVGCPQETRCALALLPPWTPNHPKTLLNDVSKQIFVG